MAFSADFPAKENNYLVNFRDSTGLSSLRPLWINPLAKNLSVFCPYIPRASTLTETFKKDIKLQKQIIFGHDAFIPCLVVFEISDLRSFSSVSKCCFVAARSDAVWRGQMCRLLPNVKYLSQQDCKFTPEQQFQIVFKRMQDRKAPFQVQLDHWNNKLSDKISEINASEASPTDKSDTIAKANIDFCGTFPGDSSSVIGSCLHALKMIPEEFNHQDVFNKLVREAQVDPKILQQDYEDALKGKILAPGDHTHRSIIYKSFDLQSPGYDPKLPLSEDLIKSALDSLREIQYTEYKTFAFAAILLHPLLKSSDATRFCITLPNFLKKRWLDKIFELNENSTTYEGKDHGNDFFNHMIKFKANSQIAKEAAFKVYQEIANENYYSV